MRKVSWVAMILLVVAMPAFAQERPVTINFGAGWAFPVSGFNDAFDAGFNFEIGATFNVSPTLGIQGEYSYQRMGGPDRTFDLFPGPGGGTATQGILESNHQMHIGTFNLVYNPYGEDTSSHAVGMYALGGLGVYGRKIELTTPSVGYASVCDPYWLVCYPTLVEVDRIIGDRSSTDFGINLGAGITFGTTAKFYVETRWHYVWGPEVTAERVFTSGGRTIDCTQGCKTNAQYFPLTFGVRF